MVMTVCNIFIIRSVRRSRLRVKSKIVRNAATSGAYSSGEFNRNRASRFEDNSCYDSSYCDTIKAKEIQVLPMTTETVPQEKQNSSKDNNNEKTEDTIAKRLEFKESNTTVLSNLSSNTDLSQLKTNLDRLSDASETDINSCLITHKAVDKVSIEKVNLRKLTEASKDVNGFIDLKTKLPPPKDRNLLHPAWQSGEEEVTSSISVTVESSTEMTINIDHPSASAESATEPVKRRKRSSPLLKRREEIRLAFSLVVVVVIFVICWLPYCISMLISVFYDGHVPREFHMFTLVIGYANSGCNPIVYGVMNKRFKVGFKRLFCFWKKTDLSFSST